MHVASAVNQPYSPARLSSLRSEGARHHCVTPHCVTHSVVVGDIGNSASILGTDFMQKHGCLLDLRRERDSRHVCESASV